MENEKKKTTELHENNIAAAAYLREQAEYMLRLANWLEGKSEVSAADGDDDGSTPPTPPPPKPPGG